MASVIQTVNIIVNYQKHIFDIKIQGLKFTHLQKQQFILLA